MQWLSVFKKYAYYCSMRTSYSALETYKQCPQKYKFQNIDRIPSGKSKEAIFGTLVHVSLRFMFQKDPLFPTVDEVLQYFKTHWPAEEKNYWSSPDEEQAYFNQGREMIKNFYSKNAPWNFTVVDLEAHFEVVLNDEKYPERGMHILSGKIDRIDKIGDDSFEIIDYKTGKRLPSQKDVDIDLQLSVYTLGVKNKWPHIDIANVRASLYFLKHGEKLSSSRTKEGIEKTKEYVLKTVNEIEKKIHSGEPFEPVPSILCNWCSYKPICPMWKHLYKKNTPTDEAIKLVINEYLSLKDANKKNNERVDELQTMLTEYLDANGLSRAFGDGGYVTKTLEKRYEYDYEKIKPILEGLNLWDAILVADDKKLKEIIKSIPEELRAEIMEARLLAKTFPKFIATKKKIENPESPVDDVDNDLKKEENFT